VRLPRRDQVWGAAFDAPLFCDVVEVVSQRLVGDKHLKLALRVDGVDARGDLVSDEATRSASASASPGGSGLDVYNGDRAGADDRRRAPSDERR
jgi:hypothetical protein